MVDLMDLALVAGVRVVYIEGPSAGVYVNDPATGAIAGVNRALNLPWRRRVLAHELGHHATSDRLATRIAHFRRDGSLAWDSAEGPAERWALETLMPTADAVPLLLRELSEDELAERFVVPVEAVRRRVQLLEHRRAPLRVLPRRAGVYDPDVPSSWVELELWREWGAPYHIVNGTGRRGEDFREVVGPNQPEGHFHAGPVDLVREPECPYDRNAVQTWYRSRHVGYVAKEVAAVLGPTMDRLRLPRYTVAGLVVGGFTDHRKHLGLRLWPDQLLTAGPRLGELMDLEPWLARWRTSRPNGTPAPRGHIVSGAATGRAQKRGGRRE